MAFTSFIVRRAVLADAPAFSGIGAASFALACPPSTPQADLDTYIGTELSVARFEEHLCDPSTSLFAAEADASVVAYLMLGRCTPPAEVTARQPLELRRLYVLPEFHGKGVAAALMAQAFEQAQALCSDALWLGVSKHNPRAIAFYRKHGFRVVGEQRFHVGSDIHEDFVMACRLAAAGSAA